MPKNVIVPLINDINSSKLLLLLPPTNQLTQHPVIMYDMIHGPTIVATKIVKCDLELSELIAPFCQCGEPHDRQIR